jgi:glycosyltransferase involved in cell wall biosynthesis
MELKGKKVLHVVNISFVLPYYIGAQFDYFQEKGVQFYVACYDDAFFRQYTQSKNITPIPANILREINIKEDFKTIRKLISAIRENEIETVIAHTPKGAMIGIIAAYFAGVKKRIYFRHGIMYETSTGFKRTLLKNIERLTSRLSTKVVCVSPSVLEKSISEKLTPRSKSLLLNKGTCNGIDDNNLFNPRMITEEQRTALKNQYHIKDTDKIVGYVGRLVKDKGIQELLTAWKEIIKKYPDAKLLLVGPYEQRDSISQEFKDYVEHEPSIIHTGLIENVTPYYTLMDVFILPSYREGFPTVVLEASAMELPVITTRSTGCIDSIVENKTGIFTAIQPGDIANAIDKYFADAALAREHGLNGRKFVVENFDQKVIWKEIEEKILST